MVEYQGSLKTQEADLLNFCTAEQSPECHCFQIFLLLVWL